jgi:membrane protein
MWALLRFSHTLFRTLAAAWDKDATERAAALTYYAVLAIFPALLMTVSLVGLAGGASDGSLSDGITTLLPAESRPVVAQALLDMARDKSASLSLSAVGGAGAIWSSIAYASVFRRALHAMHGVHDRRPAWRTMPRVIFTSATLLVLLLSSALCLVVTGALARRTGALLWPLLVVVAAALVLVLFRSGPRNSRSLRSMAPGGAVAVALWLATSAGFAEYTAHLGTYNRLYGPLAGTVVFLVWLWFSNLALMVGAHFNVEHARARSARAPAVVESGAVQGG